MRLQIQDGLWDAVGAVGAGVDVAEAANYLIVPIFVISGYVKFSFVENSF